MTVPRRMLGDQDAPYLQPLIGLAETQSKATLVAWCTSYAGEHLLPLFEQRFPDDPRPRLALEAAGEWMSGLIKLPRAKQAILACHAAAREAEGDPAAQAAARAVGQCASAIHSPRHAIGLALYGALAIAYDLHGTDAPWELLERAAAGEIGKMEAALRAVSVENEPDPARTSWKR